MSNIKLYDTVKDNQTGKRFRVTEVIGEGGSLVATLKMLDENGKAKKGRGRKMGVEALENGYTRIDLPEVTVRKIDDLSEEEREMVKVFGKKDKGAQNENQSLAGLSEEEVEEALTASTFGGSKMEDHEQMRDSLEKTNAQLRVRDHDLEVLKEECISLKEERDALRAECLDYAEDRERLRGELADARKTISKMEHQHEAEVADLNDRIMEAEAETNAIRKSKEEVLRERLRYADDLDNDSIAFEEILQLAVLMERGAKSMHEVSKMIQAKTEGRV